MQRTHPTQRGARTYPGMALGQVSGGAGEGCGWAGSGQLGVLVDDLPGHVVQRPGEQFVVLGSPVGELGGQPVVGRR